MEIKRTVRVILADDHPAVRRGVRSILEKCSYILVVGEAATGIETLHLVKELKPDVLLLDIEMPDVKGDEVAHELRKQNFPVSIVIFSACDEAHFIEEMLQSGVHGYLSKDTSPDEIRQAVLQAAQKYVRQPITQPAASSFLQLTKILMHFVR